MPFAKRTGLAELLAPSTRGSGASLVRDPVSRSGWRSTERVGADRGVDATTSANSSRIGSIIAEWNACDVARRRAAMSCSRERASKLSIAACLARDDGRAPARSRRRSRGRRAGARGLSSALARTASIVPAGSACISRARRRRAASASSRVKTPREARGDVLAEAVADHAVGLDAEPAPTPSRGRTRRRTAPAASRPSARAAASAQLPRRRAPGRARRAGRSRDAGAAPAAHSSTSARKPARSRRARAPFRRTARPAPGTGTRPTRRRAAPAPRDARSDRGEPSSAIGLVGSAAHEARRCANAGGRPGA